ncbi:BppU family phage baseplate upper protein [Mammaliicoccus sciuri]|uniref:BppU family phage baseplate upper protein n=1 Tax=Mammaliicoccus sciuri TaxID=1296 RepID=UPI00194E886A|nr:BppU family phage baseplate upper protein [Mammaliicoccus sciuri]
MAIYKNKDIETNIKATHVSLGNIGAQFYTEDENSASIRIYIKHNDKPVNLETAGLTPILSLSMQDGSYFENEPVDIVLAEQGLIQYKIRDNVIKHVGKVKATLRLKSETQSLHASEFSFNILSSGLDEQVAKEINIDLIGDKIEEVLLANASKFKGQDADPNEVKTLLEPYAENVAKQEFEKLSTAKQIDSEVINARNGKASLSQRLIESDDKVIHVKKQMNKELVGKRKRKAIMTFVDDDGRVENIQKWRQTVIDKKIPLSIGLITNWIGNDNFLTIEQIMELKDIGVEFTSHTHNHILLGNFSEKEIRDDFEKSKEILNRYGLVDDILVYPGGSQSAMVREVAREYFRCAVSTAEAQNTPPLKTFSLNRKTLAEEGYNTLEYYKQQVDNVVANNGWLIWKSHSHYASFDSMQVGYIRELIDYAREKGVEIVNMSDGLDIYGNIIDTGDYVSGATGSDYTILDNQGVLHSKTNSKDFRYIWNLGSTSTTSINDYKLGKTLEMILSDKVTGFPENKGGILETYKLNQNYYSFQTYHIFDNTKVYKRVWNRNTGDWDSWYRIDATRIKEQKVVTVTNDIPANGFKEVIITDVEVTNNDNVIVTPKAGLENGLLYNAFVGGTNSVRIRIYNMTSNVISINRPFKIDIIKL